MLFDGLRRKPIHRTVVHEVWLDGRDESVEVRGWVARRSRCGRERKTFVLIHGVGLSHRSYGRLARELSVHGTVIAVDLPGFGGLRRPKRSLSIGEHAEVVAQLLTRIHVESYVAIGHSMGAQIAVELGSTHPHRVSTVVLIGPVVNPARCTLAQQGVDLARDSAKEPASTNLMVLRDYILCGIRWFTAEVVEMVEYPTDEHIELLRIPLLVIRGEQDPIATEKWCEWLASRSRDGHMRTIPSHRHVVVHTAPAQVAGLIEAFEQDRQK